MSHHDDLSCCPGLDRAHLLALDCIRAIRLMALSFLPAPSAGFPANAYLTEFRRNVRTFREVLGNLEEAYPEARRELLLTLGNVPPSHQTWRQWSSAHAHGLVVELAHSVDGIIRRAEAHPANSELCEACRHGIYEMIGHAANDHVELEGKVKGEYACAVRLLSHRQESPASIEGDDGNDWVPANEALAMLCDEDGHVFPSHKKLTAFLEDHPEVPSRRPLTKEGKPNPRRLQVRVGPLLVAYRKDQKGNAEEAAKELERYQEIFLRKQAGK